MEPKLRAVAVANHSPARFQTRRLDPVELTIAAIDADIAKIQPLLDEYAQANRVKIHADAIPYDDLYAKLNINLTQATGAYDVVSMDDPWMPLFAGGEFLKNLHEMMDKVGLQPDVDLVPQWSALGEFPADSGMRGIPWIGNVQMFAWRTDVLDKLQHAVPATWDDVLSLATEITNMRGASGLFGIGVRGVAGQQATTSFLPVLRAYGLDLLDPVTSEPTLNTPRAARAIALHLHLVKHAPKGVEQAGHDAQGDNLTSGRIAMSGDIWPDQLLQAFDPEQSEVATKLAVGPEPSQTGARTPHVTGCWLLGIPRESRNAEAALDLILWLTAPEQQKRMTLSRTIPPTRLSILRDEEVMAALPYMPAVLDAAIHALPRPRSPHLPAIEQILGRYLADGMLGQMTAEDVAIQAQDGIWELLVREGAID
ncbi:MAG: extracellular solute-binding protein [Thermomicrobiales bacterium]